MSDNNPNSKMVDKIQVAIEALKDLARDIETAAAPPVLTGKVTGVFDTRIRVGESLSIEECKEAVARANANVADCVCRMEEAELMHAHAETMRERARELRDSLVEKLTWDGHVFKAGDHVLEDGHVFKAGDHVSAPKFSGDDYRDAVVLSTSGNVVNGVYIVDNVVVRFLGDYEKSVVVPVSDLRRPTNNLRKMDPYSKFVSKDVSWKLILMLKQGDEIRVLVKDCWIEATYIGTGHQGGSDDLSHFFIVDKTVRSIPDVHAWWMMIPANLEGAETKDELAWEDGHVFKVGDYVDAATRHFTYGVSSGDPENIRILNENEYGAAVVVDCDQPGGNIAIHFLGTKELLRLVVPKSTLRRPSRKNLPMIHSRNFVSKDVNCGVISELAYGDEIRVLANGCWITGRFIRTGYPTGRHAHIKCHFFYGKNSTVHSIRADEHAWWKLMLVRARSH